MPSTPIQINDPNLRNLQANILKGHGRNFAYHLFLQFTGENVNEAKKWISEFASSRVTSAQKQLEDTQAFKNGFISDGGTIITLSLSSTGYDKLGLQNSKPDSQSFTSGMKGRADFLEDKPENWEKPFSESLDMLIIVADDNNTTANKIANEVMNEVTPFAHMLLNQRGNVLKMKSGIGIEHFGYADGISQPLFIEDDINRQSSTDEWDDATDVNLLLAADPGASNSFGSFLVFRKLEQNVKAFKEAEESRLPLLKDVDGNDNQELAGAMIVGRFENGTPVIKSSIDLQINPPKLTNDFDYRNDTVIPALKCPFHSHIRLMNPRNGDAQAGDVSAQRITRRGIPFDEVQRFSDDDILKISDDLLDSNQPESGVGLLFMCYQSQIENQFEILQAFWANKGNIAGHIVDGQDSIIGQGTIHDKTLPAQWGQSAQCDPFSFHSFVTMRGGEYFFTPSLNFLTNLANTEETIV